MLSVVVHTNNAFHKNLARQASCTHSFRHDDHWWYVIVIGVGLLCSLVSLVFSLLSCPSHPPFHTLTQKPSLYPLLDTVPKLAKVLQLTESQEGIDALINFSELYSFIYFVQISSIFWLLQLSIENPALNCQTTVRTQLRNTKANLQQVATIIQENDLIDCFEPHEVGGAG